MRDLDDLRRAFADETAALHLDLPVDGIRRRARRVRTRRTALRAGVVALVVALAVPVAVLARGSAGTEPPARPAPSCVPSIAPMPAPWLGEPTDTRLTAATPNERVLVGLAGTLERPTLVVELRDEATDVVTRRHEFSVTRDVTADILLPTQTYSKKIVNVELALAPNRLLYVGLYARPSDDVRMLVNGYATAAGTAYNDETLWTIFWAERQLRPPLEDDGDAPGTSAPVTIRFEVYKDGNPLLTTPAMAGVDPALDPRTAVATCTR
jgi:hypothetical protein